MLEPRVSVAVMTYNQCGFLRECLESIIAQNYPNLQIVIADDGSTDGTVRLLQGFAAVYPSEVTLILADRNEGITVNHNRAFFACDGKYIAWMGGDDLMMPGKLREQVDFLEARPATAVCYHDLDVFDSSTGRSIRNFNSGPDALKPLTGSAGVLIEHGTFLGACSVMTRSSCCPSWGFECRLPIASDWLFWIETAVRGDIGFIPRVLGRYRRHDRNITATSRDMSEEFMTLAIVESRYPEYLANVRRGRARRYYTLAALHRQTGNNRAAAQYAIAAAAQSPLPRHVASHALREVSRRRT